MLAFISFRSVSLPRFWAVSALMAAATAFMAAPAQAQPAPQESLRPDTMDARVAACTACHGAQGRAGADGYYPRLAGKPQEYLFHQLLNFRDDRRQYRPMTHLLTGLPDDYLREMAAYFSIQHVPYPAPTRAEVSAATLEAGRKLALSGDATRGLPACAACHGAALGGVLPAIPGLLGLPRDYIGSQIGSWKNGLRRAAEPDCMADISNKLTPEDIGALAAWLSSQPVVEPYAPEAAGSIRLPAECGSQAQR
ncbi:c-type cytochrome [Achromobacter aegrifaciens]